MPPPPTFRDDQQLINYHDAVVYGSDLKLVEGRTEWLNDSCIHFYFTHLQQKQSTASTKMLFMDPSVISFWMHQCVDDDEIEDFVTSTPFPGTGNQQGDDGVVFIAVNDNMSAHNTSSNHAFQVSGHGSHWSLLMLELFVSDEGVALQFWHFDSVCHSGNGQAAEDIASKIRLYVYPKAQVLRTKSVSSKQMVCPAGTPQQQNGYDCGVLALGAAKILSRHVVPTTTPSNNRQQELEVCLKREFGKDLHGFCSKLRKEISSEIRRLHQGTGRT